MLFQLQIQGRGLIVLDLFERDQNEQANPAVAQNVGTLPESRHSTFHFITIQIRAVLAEQYQNYSSRIFYKIMRQL